MLMSMFVTITLIEQMIVASRITPDSEFNILNARCFFLSIISFLNFILKTGVSSEGSGGGPAPKLRSS